MGRRLSAERPYTPLDESLISRVLQPEAAEAAATPASVRAVPSSGHPHAPAVVAPPGEPAVTPPRRAPLPRMECTLRLRVSRRDKREFEAFTARVGAALDATLKPSNVLRAMLCVLQNAEPALADLARQASHTLRRPPNDDAVAYAEFEDRLVRLIDSAVRHSPPVR